MESKAPKAAIEEIKQRIKDDIERRSVYDVTLVSIETIIDEYDLKDKLDIIESVYDALMKKGYYKEAASFAKKYGL